MGGRVRSLARGLWLALFCTGVLACHHGAPQPPPGPEAKTTLKVENEGFPDMNIYVLPGDTIWVP